MSRPDLTWLREAVGLGSLFDATRRADASDAGLVELAFDGGTLLAADPRRRRRHDGPAADTRARSHSGDERARRAQPAQRAVRAPCRRSTPTRPFDHVIVQIAVGGVLLLAEVTRDAVAALGIVVGMPLHALIKSVSIDVLRPERSAQSHWSLIS